MNLDLPDDLAPCFAEEPVLDLYAYGPWRVPDGLYETIRDRAVALAADERFAGWRAEVGSYYATPTNGVGPAIDGVLDFLMGACAVRRGWWGDRVYLTTDPFAADPPRRDPRWDAYSTQHGRWRPPGWITFAAAGDDPEQRALNVRLGREILDVFAGLEPIEVRRQALIRLYAKRLADPESRAVDAHGSWSTVRASWDASADDSIRAALPELAGPVGYLSWILEGFGAVHQTLRAAIGDGGSVDDLLGDVLQCAATEPPAELAALIGPDRFTAVRERFRTLGAGMDRDQWWRGTARWLTRGAVAGQLRACRAWLDMINRLGGALYGLPDTACNPSDIYVPVRLFEEQVRALLLVPAVTNPLATAFAPPATAAVTPTPGAPPAAIDRIVAAPELRAALTALPAGRAVRLLIAGPEGSGKGLAVDAVAEHLAGTGQTSPPVWLPAAVLAGKDVGPAVSAIRTEIERCLDRTVLVVDGLDELVRLGEAGTEAAEELRRNLDQLDALNVVALCGPGGDEDVYAANPALARSFATVHTRDFDEATFAAVFAREVAELGAQASAEVVAGAGAALRAMRPYRNLRNGHLAAAVAEDAVSAARKRSGEQHPTLVGADVPAAPAGALGADARNGGDPLAELESLIGLTAIKDEVRLLCAEARAEKMRRAAGLVVRPPTRHLAFTGNPGTAKTTVAELVARIYRQVGLLSSGHLVQASRPDLVGEYIGQTAPRVRAVVERALGGVLFIDEAYSLADGYGGYGAEAVATLVEMMEDHRDDLVVIVAGYDLEMGTFLASNSGLSSRFARRLHFPDYTDVELLAIFRHMAASAGFVLAAGVDDQVTRLLAGTPRGAGFGNARFVRNTLDRALARQALRLTADGTATPADPDTVRLLLPDDVPPPEGDSHPPAPATGAYL